MEAAPQKNYGTNSPKVPNPLDGPLSLALSYFLFPVSLLLTGTLFLIGLIMPSFLFQVKIAYGATLDAVILFWIQLTLFIPALFIVSDLFYSIGWLH